MKSRLLLIASVASFSGFAQNQECLQNMSIFSEYAKVKNYKDAYTPWKSVFDKCPELHYATYVYGERILKDKLERENDKKAVMAQLKDLYEKYNQYFPAKFSEAEKYTRQAMVMVDGNIGTKQEIYDLLDKAYKTDKENFSDEIAMYNYFASCVDLYNEGKKDLQSVFDNYDDVSEIIEQENNKLSLSMNKLLPKEEANTLSEKEKKELAIARVRINNLESASESIDAKIGQLADCQNLIPLYEKNFDANKENVVWLRRAAGRMSDKDCTSSDMFVKVVENLNKLEPSANTAYYLGVLADKQKNNSEAVKYYNQAVDLEADPLKKSRILTRIATKYSGANAVSYAQKALSFNPSNSTAYQIIAAAYAHAANDCGKTAFEKRAVYWLAASVARKAGLENLAARYDKLAPSRADIFSAGMKGGETITFKCWIGKSVKVPYL